MSTDLGLKSLMLWTLVGSSIAQKSSCSTASSGRTDCGFAGISQAQCESNGCCWSPLEDGSSEPWCFYQQSSSTSCSLVNSQKTDCGYSGITQSQCESSGCCWSEVYDGSTPWCFFSAPSGYQATNVASSSTGLTFTLQIISPTMTSLGSDISNLQLDLTYETADRLHAKIYQPGVSRWEVPESVLPRPSGGVSSSSSNLQISYTTNPFTLTATRKSDGVVVFSIAKELVFKDQYLQLTSSFASGTSTFGLGESTRSKTKLDAGTYTLWNLDNAASNFNKNLYGSHPFYLQLSSSGAAHGVFLLNSNGMDVTLGQTDVTFKVIGGVLDFYVMNGPELSSVMQEYQQVIGLPKMVNYWSLGFHNCKYGYTSVYEIESVVANYAAASIPLDVQWADIDYMDEYRDFSLDPTNFPSSEMNSLVNSLHANGQHFVPIIDPGIMVDAGYPAYDHGIDQEVFVRDIKGNFYMSQVWPGPTYFPDWFHPSISDYWLDELSYFHSMLPYDGVWIDMNEASNFCNSDGAGQVCTAPSGCPNFACQTCCCLSCSTVDSTNKYDFPPYDIHNAYGLLSVKTIAQSAVHYGNVSEYDSHNLYGLMESIETMKAVEEIRGQRGFVLSRSTYAGSGAHTAHWTGDNAATWNDLKASIVTIINFGLFGVPMIGADICGFNGNSWEELCTRWIEVGAFYPFSRDHSAIGTTPQELYVWPSVAEASRTVLALRYRMLPHLYTLMFNAALNGDLVARGLWFNFPQDSNTLSIDTQFMLGDSILISPVLDAGVTSLSAYFPTGVWYNLFDYSKIDTTSGGATKTLSTPLTSTNVHVRGGAVIPMQDAAMTSSAARLTPFTFLIALDSAGSASGSLFFDDGEQLEPTSASSSSLKLDFTASGSKSFTSSVARNTYAGASSLMVDTVQVLGVKSAPSSVSLNGKSLSSSQFVYDGSKLLLTISSLKTPINTSFSLAWM